MKTKTIKNIILLIFLATVIPTIILYSYHALIEFQASQIAKTHTKFIKTTSEGILFSVIAIGYIITTILIIIRPNYKIPYLVILVGTVIIAVIYNMRIFGLPIPFTEIVITDLSSDWMDSITKICQQIIPIPVTILLVTNTSYFSRFLKT